MEVRSDGASVILPADMNQVDETGWVWAFLSDASDVARIARGSVIVAGDSAKPFLARVIDIVAGPGDEQIVHLDVIGVPDAR
jgi:hypothetical protein